MACLVLGSSWTVYSNIIAANVYPTLEAAGYDDPVVGRPKLALRSTAQAISEAFSALTEAPVIEQPATVPPITPTMFNCLLYTSPSPRD